MKRLLLAFWRRLRWRRSDSDLADELNTHFELDAEDRAGAGAPEGEARRCARLELGRTPGIIERVRDQELVTILGGWYRDFMFGLRAMRKSPVFCVTAILTLALGIGANTAIFALLYGLVLRSLPVHDPGRLFHITILSAAQQLGEEGSVITFGMLKRFRNEQHSFTDISAWDGDGVTMPDREGTLRFYDALLVSGNAFQVIGLKPYVGRLIGTGDEVRGGPAEGWPVVLSYGFWNDHFGADRHIIGRQIRVSDTPVTIAGITPPEFHGVYPGARISMYLPLQFANVLAKRDVLNTATSFYGVSAIGRLKPGVTIDQAQAEVTFHQKELFRDFIPMQYERLPFFEKASLRVFSARAGLPSYFGHVYAKPLYLMQGLLILVLLFCCVNVGGLMMSKVYSRQREFAVRTAIGAARWRLIRQYLTESFIIASAGAMLGAAAAWYGAPVLLHYFRNPMMFEPISVQPDKSVFWVSSLCAIAATILFGALPAWRAGRSNPATLLTSRTGMGGRGRIAGRAFVPVQVAMSVVLVTLAALLSQSLIRIETQRKGFSLDQVTIQTPPFNLLPQKDDARIDVYQRMVDRLDQMPGIRSAAVTMDTPMTGYQRTSRFEAITENPNPPEDSHMAYNDVGPGYFRTMETRILEGREFQPNERTTNVCILNRSAASFLFPHEEALNRYVRSKDTKDFPRSVSCRVIGIAEDAIFWDLREPPPRTIYFPVTLKTVEDTNLVFLINAGTKAEAIAGYRKALSEIAPTIPLVLFVTLREQMDAALGSERLITLLSNFFAGLALLLSALGLYGLLSSSIAQRTSEMGMRIALGAQRGTILRMILGEALDLLGAGVLLGAVGLFAAVRFVQNMLFGVGAFDPTTLAVTLIVLLAAALFAALPPALRAASVDPIRALRVE